MATVPYSRRIPNAEWERHHPKIEALFKDEGKTLKEVMAIMRKENFHAR
jgi:hypothetical protein